MSISSFSFLGLLKTIHGWLGFFVLPWIIMLGLMGFYLNHSKLVLSYLPNQTYDEANFDKWPNPVPITQEVGIQTASQFYGTTSFRLRTTQIYHNRDVWIFQAENRDELTIDKATGHYWVKTGYSRYTYDPDGRQLDYKFYWGSIFKTLHTQGWTTSKFGTWLVDIASGAMVYFGLSGFFMFLIPKLRRRGNRSGGKMPPPPAGRSRAPAQSIKVERKTPRPKRITLE
ncbi:MAG: PepSY domain-containing protein [Proteobacteria bacterium]|nr:PepSY domain-containing protein [Pseudomonadota bacterium]